MLRVETFNLGPLQTNAYLLRGEDDLKAVVIDPGMNPAALMRRVEHLHVEAILLTHAHFDHIGGVEELRRAKGCPVYLHDLEADWLTDAKHNGSAMWSELGGPVVTEPAEFALAQGQTLNLIGHDFKVLHTPGHSPGSVSFLCDKDLFAGDVLFREGVGRTDLYGGRQRDLEDSIRLKLYKLPDETVVYPGHGPRTKIGHEKIHNPFVPAL